MIDGNTQLIAHLGFPTAAFKAPLIYNPWFERRGINAVVVPIGIEAGPYPALLRALFESPNVRGALVTMPHKIATLSLVDELTPAARIAGACNAVRREPSGRLLGDQFDGAGFVLGVARKGVRLAGARVLLVGCGGVGRAIAASLAGAGIDELRLHDRDAHAVSALSARLREHYPALRVVAAEPDPAGCQLAINATPAGMAPDDPLPMDVLRLAPGTLVGDVVMAREYTPLLSAAQARGCPVQVGTDMLFEMIPAYLSFFGFGSASADELRAYASIRY